MFAADRCRGKGGRDRFDLSSSASEPKETYAGENVGQARRFHIGYSRRTKVRWRTMSQIHPFYEAHRASMESSMRQRLDLVSDLLADQVGAIAVPSIKDDVMREFEIV